MPAVGATLKKAYEDTRSGHPSMPPLVQLCSSHGLGAEVKDNKKIEERRAQLKREAEQLAQNGRSCVKKP